MSDIFLSYQSNDRVKAEPVAKALGDLGWSVFWDRRVPVGRTWPDVLNEELTAAKCVVVLWSQSAAKSRWVRLEATAAFERNMLVPAKIEEVNLPVVFDFAQTAWLADWDGNPDNGEFQGLVRAVAGLAGYPEGSRRSIESLRRRNHADLATAIASRGFSQSSRSEKLYYSDADESLRVRFTDTRVRIEKKSERRWRVERSVPLERPIDLFLNALERATGAAPPTPPASPAAAL